MKLNTGIDYFMYNVQKSEVGIDKSKIYQFDTKHNAIVTCCNLMSWDDMCISYIFTEFNTPIVGSLGDSVTNGSGRDMDGCGHCWFFFL